QVAGEKIGKVGRRGANHDDRQPIKYLMRRAVKALKDKDKRERDREKGQAGDMAEPQIVGEEVAHVRAKDAREAKRGPISQPQSRHMVSLHRSVSPAQIHSMIDAAKFRRCDDATAAWRPTRRPDGGKRAGAARTHPAVS